MWERGQIGYGRLKSRGSKAEERAMELIASVCIGIGLAAACGARVFLPLFVLSVASYLGLATPTESFAFVASPWAVAALGVACVLELGAYNVPMIDHAVDVAGAPAAVLAGTLATAANLHEAQPLVMWGTALIGGGGVALAVRSATTSTRAVSTLSTGALANWFLATLETVLAGVMAVLAVLLPIFAGVIVLLALTAGAWVALRIRRARKARRAMGQENDLDSGEQALDVFDSLEEARTAAQLSRRRRIVA